MGLNGVLQETSGLMVTMKPISVKKAKPLGLNPHGSNGLFSAGQTFVQDSGTVETHSVE